MIQNFNKHLITTFLLILAITLQATDLPFEKSEYTDRRAKFMENIPDGIAVILGSRGVPQNNDINYLCGVDIPGTILIIDGINKKSIILYTTSIRFLEGEGHSSKFYSDPTF